MKRIWISFEEERQRDDLLYRSYKFGVLVSPILLY